MLKLSWIEIFLRLIPEMLIVVWGVYVITRSSFNAKKYILASIIMGVMTFLVRLLPIYFGVHTFIIMVLTIFTMSLLGVQTVKATYATFIMFIVLSLSEFINIGILDLFYSNYDSELINPIIKSLLGVPSLIVMCLVVLGIRFFIKKKNHKHGNKHSIAV